MRGATAAHGPGRVGRAGGTRVPCLHPWRGSGRRPVRTSPDHHRRHDDRHAPVDGADAPEAAGPSFADLGVAEDLVRALETQGITHPFAIQTLALPLVLRGDDVIGQARTGTGKTLAFGLGLLTRVKDDSLGGPLPRALVVVPTRELGIQVARDLEVAAVNRDVKVLTIYGGRAYEPQIDALRAGVDVVVGTPGRLLDLAQQGHLDLSGVRSLVLDEADEMLDLGFLPDVEKILAQCPTERQTLLFSATMPGAVVTMSRRFMTRPVHVAAEQPDEGRTVPTTHQHVFRAHAMDKVELLSRILQARGRGLTIVFARTKRTADRVAEDLQGRGFAAAPLHGDLGQGARERALRAFRSGKVDVLVATDVAARGIDVSGVTHVINYQCPEDEKVYLHRIGRTGRAGQAGYRRDVRRLGRHDEVADDQPGAGAAVPGAGGDLLEQPARLRGAGHPRGHEGPAAEEPADPRGARGRGRGGPRRDRQGAGPRRA